MTETTSWPPKSWIAHSSGGGRDIVDAAATPSTFDQVVDLLGEIERGEPNEAPAVVSKRPALPATASPAHVFFDKVVRAYGSGTNGRAEALAGLRPPEGQLAANDRWIANLAEAYRLTWLSEILTRGAESKAIGNLDALEHANVALATLSTLPGAELVVAKANLAKGRIYAWRGEMVRAIEALNTALAAANLLRNRQLTGEAAYELGVAYRDQRRYEVSLPLLRVSVGVLQETGPEGRLARARQGLALALIGLAKAFPDRATEALAEGRRLAHQAYDFGARPAKEPGKLTDSFRAVMAARDLGEIALLSPETSGAEARDWLRKATDIAFAGRAIDRNVPFYNQVLLPAFAAHRAKTNSAAAAARAWQDAVSFETLRLVELEAMIEPDINPRDVGIRFEQIYLVWEQRREPTYAIDALLYLADIYATVANDPTAGSPAQWRARNGEARARHLAFERALAINADLKSLRHGATDGFTKTELEICQRLGGRPVMLLSQQGGRRVLRVDLQGQAVPARLSILPEDEIATKDATNVVGKLTQLAVTQSCLPRFIESGVTAGLAWFLDEERAGRPLADMAAAATSDNFRDVLVMIEEIAETLRSLSFNFTGLSSAWIDPDHILVQPGWRPVIAKLGPIQLGPPAANGIYQRSIGIDANENAMAVARLAAMVLNNWGSDAIRRAGKGELAIYQKSRKADAFRRLLVEMLNGKPRKLEELIDACVEATQQWSDGKN